MIIKSSASRTVTNSQLSVRESARIKSLFSKFMFKDSYKAFWSSMYRREGRDQEYACKLGMLSGGLSRQVMFLQISIFGVCSGREWG